MAFDFSSLVGKMIRLDRGGPESRQGQVVSVGSDYIVIYNEKDGFIYYNVQHLKSVTQNTKDDVYWLENTEDLPKIQKYIVADTFYELLTAMKNLWCQVNRGGHESVQGVLTEVGDNYVTMIVNHEVITILTYHIKSISYGVKKENQEEKKEQNQDNKDNKNSKDNKDSKDSKEKK